MLEQHGISTDTALDNPEMEVICRATAEIIGGDVTPDRVHRIIEALNAGHHIVHGIKSNNLVPTVLQKGIAPLTPEGGEKGGSFWTSGAKVFGHSIEGTRFSSYDTTFFHYAHSSDSSNNSAFMTMALTNDRIIHEHGLTQEGEISDDCYITIQRLVPRELICVLRVEIKNVDKKNVSPRIYGQIAEQKMFELLEDAVINGYRPGEMKEISLDAADVQKLPEAA